MAGPVPAALARRLPGLAAALDGEAAAASVQQLLLQPGTSVQSAVTHSVWVRSDGTCSLRYRVSVTQPSGGSPEHVVLGRVCPDRVSAAAYVSGRCCRWAPVDECTATRGAPPQPCGTKPLSDCTRFRSIPRFRP
jgi:hypothetical protein